MISTPIAISGAVHSIGSIPMCTDLGGYQMRWHAFDAVVAIIVMTPDFCFTGAEIKRQQNPWMWVCVTRFALSSLLKCTLVGGGKLVELT